MNSKLAFQLLRLYGFSLIFIAASYILGAGYLGVNGHQVWRQADVYSYLLAFADHPTLRPLDNFFGKLSPYDFPIYTYGIAKIAATLGADPLVVTRNLNFLAFLAAAKFGFGIARHFFGLAAGVVFLSLICTSRLILHYFSVPLPDVLGIALALGGTSALLRGARRSHWMIGVAALSIAALIKSPVAFPFVLCLMGLTIITRSNEPALPADYRHRVLWASVGSLFAALAAEVWRAKVVGISPGLVNSAIWYFGTLDMRLSAGFWQIFWSRLRDWGPPIFPWTLLLGIAALGWSGIQIFHRKLLACLLVSFFLPWLVFANLYFIHDYYQLSVVFLIALFAAGLSGLLFKHLLKITPAARWIVVLIALDFLFAQIALILTAPFSERARTSTWEAMEVLIPPKDTVLVAGDATHNIPYAGGRLGRRIVTIESGPFEVDCGKHLSDYTSIVATYPSTCLNVHRAEADAFFVTPGASLWVKRSDSSVHN